MEIEVTTDAEKWKIAHSQIENFAGKVYYSFGYLNLCQLTQNGYAFIAIGKVDSRIVVYYPFILRKVSSKISKDDAYSIEAPYGYGGPAIFTDEVDESDYIDDFYNLFKDWCLENQVIAEFVRFNPLDNKSVKLLKNVYDIELNRNTVGIQLFEDKTKLLNHLEPARKRNFQKAVKSQLEFRITNSIDNFKRLYILTMNRVSADKFYYFTEQYFQKMVTNNGFEMIIVDVLTKEGVVIASSIFLLDNDTIHFHLGASDSAYNSYNPNVYLMVSMADYVGKLGYKELHIGGGSSSAPDNSLYRYKKGFSSHQHKFYIGKKIYNQKKYDEVSKNWINLTGKQPSKLLHYHDGVS